MTIRPILFSGPMIRALLEGRKTQTRRVLTPPAGCVIENLASTDPHLCSGLYDDPTSWGDSHADDGSPICLIDFAALKYTTGDLLYVRESFARSETGFAYMADHPGDTSGMGWRPSIHMPREASRLTLKVTDVRVQRVQDISEEDALAEGVCKWVEAQDKIKWGQLSSEVRHQMVNSIHGSAVAAFQHLWDSLNEKRGYGWDKNPWVIAVTFEVHRCNVDQFNREVAA